ncbi:MAG: hypothetical protein ACRC1K_13680 [Planctomycetia bacterium]
MSTDYFIFMHCHGPVSEKVSLLGAIDGVSIGSDSALRISGLDDVRIMELSDYSQTIMKEDYGAYGLEVNWEIMGTFDGDSDMLEVMERLYRCVAAIVNEHPNDNCSLMRNGESFLAINTQEQLVISPIYLEAIPFIRSLFQKHSTIVDP